MAPHDPLFKSLLRTFFGGFLRLVAPDLAARLDLAAPVFLDKEFPAFGPPAGSRVVDLLARVPLNDASGKDILIHVEVEARARPGIGERVRSYHRRIQTRHEGQILSIVVFIKGGKGGIHEESLGGDLAGPGLPPFRYLSFGLSRCPVREYLDSSEPLAWALAALMNRGKCRKAELKMSCLSRISEALLTDAERVELVNCVESYVRLSHNETEEFLLLGTPERRRAPAMLYRMSWKDEMLLEGERRGIRRVLCDQIEDRFGPVPDEIRSRIETIRSLDRLQRLARKLPSAKSLKSLRLG
ncbi:MAG TPA: hypothetical protein VGG20_29525 [Thermoanaerobaculia bacterium]|jgi:hypothetical protein